MVEALNLRAGAWLDLRLKKDPRMPIVEVADRIIALFFKIEDEWQVEESLSKGELGQLLGELRLAVDEEMANRAPQQRQPLERSQADR